jgi:phage I-like protein
VSPAAWLRTFLANSDGSTSLSAELTYELTALDDTELPNDGQPSAQGLVPGKEFRIFQMGKNDSEKGQFTLTPENAQRIALSWEKRGVDTMIDAGHSVLKEQEGQVVPAVGWCKVQARPDGLYAVDVKWTAQTAPLVKNGQIRYFSPLFEHTKDGVILNLQNLAVTGIPATHGISPLSNMPTSLSDPNLAAPPSNKGKEGGKPPVSDLPTQNGPSTIAVKPLSTEGKTMPPTEEVTNPVIQAVPKKMKLAAYLAARIAEHDGEDLAKECGMRGDRMDAIKGGETPSQEELSKLSKALRVKSDHLSKLAVEPEEAPQAPQEPAGKEAKGIGPDTMGGTEPREIPGKSKDGIDRQGLDPLLDTLPIQGLTALTTLADRSTPEIKGLVMGLIDNAKNSARVITELSTRVRSIEAEKSAGEVAAIVQTALSEGKITPAQKDWALKLGRESKGMLTSYLSVAPKLGPGVGAFTAPKPTAVETVDDAAIEAYAKAQGLSVAEVRESVQTGLSAVLAAKAK